ncbi:MAG: hypothetical protein K0Q79_3662 [Flavipsychrobacter sp.]|jgi:hypothetical protein|nr:hypothetical protein [Flavipsychrobacter sp.]
MHKESPRYGRASKFTKQQYVKELTPGIILGVYDAKFQKGVWAAKSIFLDGTETVPSRFLHAVWARV